jgi:hypothetical protein
MGRRPLREFLSAQMVGDYAVARRAECRQVADLLGSKPHVGSMMDLHLDIRCRRVAGAATVA